jgi:hypothetical protein
MPTRTPDRRFVALILTHGRPDKVITHRSLRRHGYTGPILVVIDNEDSRADEYRERYHGVDGTEVVQFDKAAEALTFDTMDQSADRRAIVYARNASTRIARERGYTHVVQLDDDYSTFIYRLNGPGPRSRFGVSAGSQPVKSMDRVVELMLDLLEDTGAKCVAFSQGGDHIGGFRSTTLRQGFKRKAMNSLFMRTADPVRFVGRINEDVNAYTLDGSRGALYLTVTNLQLQQIATQTTSGGMTDLYRDSGTYLKSFYTVMLCPSFVDIRSMGRTDRRLHHHVQWDNAVPKVLAPGLRKLDPGGG